MNDDSRPVNLDLTKFAFPITSITSIAHRIAGVALFVGVAIGLYALDLSLSSEAGYERVIGLMASVVGKLVLWAVLSALVYHFVAGIKHLLLDLEIGDSLAGGKLASGLTILLSVAGIVLAGIQVLRL